MATRVGRFCAMFWMLLLLLPIGICVQGLKPRPTLRERIKEQKWFQRFRANGANAVDPSAISAVAATTTPRSVPTNTNAFPRMDNDNEEEEEGVPDRNDASEKTNKLPLLKNQSSSSSSSSGTTTSSSLAREESGGGNDNDYRYNPFLSSTAVATAAKTSPSCVRTPSSSSSSSSLPVDFVPLLLRGCQMGLVLYLIRSVFVAAKEVMDEIAADSGDGQQPPFFSKHAVWTMLEDIVAATTTNNQKAPRHYFSPLARRLALTMRAPLYSPHKQRRQRRQQQQENNEPVSLESILLSLTRTEVHLLEQCLYMPPAHLENESFQDVWSRVAGHKEIQQAILSRLVNSMHNNNNNENDDDRVKNPYDVLLRGDGVSGFSSKSSGGMLLYGPPGCGKSLLLQTICASVRRPCLTVTPSVLFRKYLGETNQRIRALFSLVSKLSDGGDGCVVILDELDGLFRERRFEEHEASREAKTEFMQLWDGISSSSGSHEKLWVLGATNRPFDVDSAILRRMPQAHYMGLPDAQLRRFLMNRWLSTVPTEPNLSLDAVVEATEGYTCSDLVQLVRAAILQGPAKDVYSLANKDGSYRALGEADLLRGHQATGATPLSSPYCTELINFFRQRHCKFPREYQEEQYQQQQQEQQSLFSGSYRDAGTFNVETYHLEKVDDEQQNGQDKSENAANHSMDDDDDDDDEDFDDEDDWADWSD